MRAPDAGTPQREPQPTTIGEMVPCPAASDAFHRSTTHRLFRGQSCQPRRHAYGQRGDLRELDRAQAWTTVSVAGTVRSPEREIPLMPPPQPEADRGQHRCSDAFDDSGMWIRKPRLGSARGRVTAPCRSAGRPNRCRRRGQRWPSRRPQSEARIHIRRCRPHNLSADAQTAKPPASR